MSLDGLLRPVARSFCVGLTALVLMPQSGTVQAQQYGAPTQYGEPYAPPSGVGGRRSMDGTPRRETNSANYGGPGIWQGLYIGGHGAYVTGSAWPAGTYDTVSFSGGGLGLHGGYNFQRHNWVFGLEADGGWSNASGSRTFADPATVNAGLNWNSSFRLRAGYAVNNVLLYATGGIALGNFDLSVATPSVASGFNKTAAGYVVGGGIEMKFARDWSGRVEALYYGFNSDTYNFASGSVPVDLGVTTVRAGITYHFN